MRVRFAKLVLAASTLFISSTAAYADCTNFSWPMARERALFESAPAQTTAWGTTLTALPGQAIRLGLTAGADAKFAKPPEHAPKLASWYGGWIALPAPPKGGAYVVTLGDGGWVDVVQGDSYVASIDHTSDHDCGLMRKSVKFALAAAPFTVQVSDVKTATIVLTILPVEDAARN